MVDLVLASILQNHVYFKDPVVLRPAIGHKSEPTISSEPKLSQLPLNIF